MLQQSQRFFWCVMVCWCALLIGCDGEDGGGGSGSGSSGFCRKLEAVKTCAGGLEECNKEIAIDDIEYPACVQARETLLGCLTRTQMICPSLGTLYANATENTGQPYSLGPYTAWADATCAPLGDAWVSCKNCGEALKKLPEISSGPTDQTTNARCASNRQAFLDCVNDEALACPSTDIIEAGADSETDSPNAGRELSFDNSLKIFVNPTCGALYDTWQGCVYCGGGLGYEKSGKDVGMACATSGECAQGLSCVFGHCTAPCDPQADTYPCAGRKFVDGVCVNDDARETTCSHRINACIVACSDNSTCQSLQSDGFCPGNGAILDSSQSNIVEYGYCFFGACREDGWGCASDNPFP
jgi:hypothetical protein